ncbi:hypothetical protein Nepgr_010324 [Nepenthes gracilis]|uniref:Cyclic nucleotide-binding domain-containing protein n=1 Tax=Nepenthes gracilis TaxID=150966 RepID=A0AAD3SCN7_NEPGR|nr:hypothetical protein Nepgr_010324 [Nepenthes gracilis]
MFYRCDPEENITFQYGIFENAVVKNILSSNFIKKYFYCWRWGLQQLSSYGQILQTNTFIGETLFSILIAIVGLVLVAHLIGNKLTYLQSLTVRLEEGWLKRRDTGEWMRHRQLPEDLKQLIRYFVQYRWLATRGMDEEAILRGLPSDLHRDIQRHLCLDLVRNVPLFSQMDGQLLDAICDRRVSPLSTQGAYIVCEGDFVTEMLFIFRGWLQSTTTNGGRTGFFNSITLRPGAFAFSQGDEWANPFWKLVHDGLNTSGKKQVLAANGMQMCHPHCPVQLLVGYTRKVQFSLGQLAVFNVPAEVTTRNGRRHREDESQAIGQSEADGGGSWKPDVSVVHNENLKLVHS